MEGKLLTCVPELHFNANAILYLYDFREKIDADRWISVLVEVTICEYTK